MSKVLSILLLGLALGGSTLPGAVRCTTHENTLLARLETTCDDGTRAISRWNALLSRWETTVIEPPRLHTPCTMRVNPTTKRLERRCP